MISLNVFIAVSVGIVILVFFLSEYDSAGRTFSLLVAWSIATIVFNMTFPSKEEMQRQEAKQAEEEKRRQPYSEVTALEDGCVLTKFFPEGQYSRPVVYVRCEKQVTTTTKRTCGKSTCEDVVTTYQK